MDGNWTNPFPKNWKGENGVYSVGFSRQDLLGVSADAGRVAEDIARQWRSETQHLHVSNKMKLLLLLKNKQFIYSSLCHSSTLKRV